MDIVEFFGQKAGKVWKALNEGEKTLTQLQKSTGLTLKEVSMGLGWLAKEEKLIFRNKKVYVKGNPDQKIELDRLVRHCQSHPSRYRRRMQPAKSHRHRSKRWIDLDSCSFFRFLCDFGNPGLRYRKSGFHLEII